MQRDKSQYLHHIFARFAQSYIFNNVSDNNNNNNVTVLHPGILPQGQDWPAHVSQWFKTTIGNKSLYALVTGQDSNMNQNTPRTLVVRLIDTSGSEDLVVDEYMVSQEMAVAEPSSD